MQANPTTTFPDACDCHVHIYDSRFALIPNVPVLPPDAPVSAYRAVQQALGLRRAIIVQPTGYGFDNSCALDALAQLGDTARGIALIAADVPDAQIERLHAAGMRGVRFMMIGEAPRPLGWHDLAPMAARLAGFGWMVNLQFDGREMAAHEEVLKRLPCQLVIDHNAKFLEPVSPDHAAFQALLRVLDSGRVWIKLSAPYETSKTGAPAFEDVSLLSRTLAEKFPERCLWASNWPHPGRNPAPSDRAMYEILSDWAPSTAVRQRILVDNPAALYGF